MRLIRAKIEPRTEYRISKIDGIQMYDYDNMYPNRLTNIVNTSGTAKFCIDLYAKFIKGGGFKEQTFYKSVVNQNGLKLDKLLRKVANDYALRNGFAIHVNYNALYQIINVRNVPFHDCRLADPEGEHKGMIVVYDDWGRIKSTNIYKQKFQFFDTFNTDPDIIDQQVEKAGGWDKWQGQILWYSEAGNEYPLAKYDPRLDDIETDGRIASFKKRKAGNGFNADFFFVHKGPFEDDEEREDFKKELEDFQGDDRAGNVPLIEVEKDEQVPILLAVPKTNADSNFYQSNEISVQSNIRKVWGFHPVLTGEFVPGKLGMAQDILDGCAYANGMTTDERLIMEETFQSIFSLWHDPAINPTKDYSIIPLTLISEEATKEVSVGEEATPGAPGSAPGSGPNTSNV